MAHIPGTNDSDELAQMQRRQHPASKRRSPRFAATTVLATLATAVITVGPLGPTPTASAAPATADSFSFSEAPTLGSMYSVVDQVQARQLWEQGITGKGINVAVIDTGVADVPALSGPDKVVAMVDLSAEASVEEAVFYDTYGHGTHMAGIIAGRDPGVDPALAAQHPEWFLGVAPDAGIVSVKVADNTGSADVSQVIAGIDWVVDHADELDIRVINLSYSSASELDSLSDPLSYAVERAWKAGIVVVVAAGNEGRTSRGLAVPASNDYVISVAAAEAEYGKSKVRFRVPKWVNAGDWKRSPDVSAPGTSIESLRAPLSRVDVEHPEGFVDFWTFKGSGSSQAAAVVSGSAALLLSARPELNPDQIKKLLMLENTYVRPGDPKFSGEGLIKLGGLVDRPISKNFARQTHRAARGNGSLDDARGGSYVIVNGEELRGEVTYIGTPWDATRWTGTRWTSGEWDGTRWTGGEWMGTRWTDAAWTGAEWLATRWTGTRWTATRWTDAEWSATRWTDEEWSATRWTGENWEATRWTDEQWAATRWTDEEWSATRWSDEHWAGARWTGTRWSDSAWSDSSWTGTRWSGTRWTSAEWTGAGWSEHANVDSDDENWTATRWTATRWSGTTWN